MSYLKAGIRIAVGGLLLWLVFRDTDWRSLGATLRGVSLVALLVSIGCVVAAQLARVQRWTYIVRATAPARFRSIFSAAQIGLLANVALPMRIGDVVRAVLLARLSSVPVARSLVLVALDRINDTLGLLAVCAVVLFSLPLNRSVEIPGGVLGVEGPVVVSESVVRAVVLSFALAVAMVLALLAALYLRSAQILRIAERVFRPLPERLARRLRRVLAELADGLHVLGSPRASAKSLGFSLLAWGCGVAAIAAVLHSFGLGFSWRTPFLMQAMIALFVIVPLAPGLVGQFHLAVLACLLMALPAVSLDEARAVALVMHLVAVVPIAVLGGASLALERLGLEDLVRVDARARATDAGA